MQTPTTQVDQRLTLGAFDVEGFRRRLLEILMDSGVDGRSPYLAPLYKMIDDDVQWYLANQPRAAAVPAEPAAAR